MSVPLPSTGHRERKKQRVKEKLAEAAMRLFLERGFEETRIDDIVAEVDLVPRTFFRYFCTKDDALFGWYDVLIREAEESLRARPRGEGIVQALNAVLRVVGRNHHERERVVLVLHELIAKSPELRTRQNAVRYDHQRLLARTLATRLHPSAALVAETVTAVVFTAYTIAVDQWAAEGAPRQLDDYTDASVSQAVKLLQSVDQQYVLE